MLFIQFLSFPVLPHVLRLFRPLLADHLSPYPHHTNLVMYGVVPMIIDKVIDIFIFIMTMQSLPSVGVPFLALSAAQSYFLRPVGQYPLHVASQPRRSI